jgi:epoxyqueuosine reductase
MGHLQVSDVATLKALAIRTALEAGAGAVAIAPAFSDEETHWRLRASFDRGDLATWRYDDAYARRASDPQTILPDAKSVICIALPYATPPPRPACLRGRVSNYAWSRDYHHRMRALLTEVARELDDAAGAPVTAVVCDTAHIAERAFAARSGLGWVGKHTNLISPLLGSYIFLGEVVTSLALVPDEPVRKSCGSCTQCIEACPTGALRGDYTIDATRCISDLTQRTDGIPREARALVGDWVWGCDLCQVACPPTQRAGIVPSPRRSTGCCACAAASSRRNMLPPPWAGEVRPCCGATRRSRSAMRWIARVSGSCVKRLPATRIRWCADMSRGRSGVLGRRPRLPRCERIARTSRMRACARRSRRRWNRTEERTVRRA